MARLHYVAGILRGVAAARPAWMLSPRSACYPQYWLYAFGTRQAGEMASMKTPVTTMAGRQWRRSINEPVPLTAHRAPSITAIRNISDCAAVLPDLRSARSADRTSRSVTDQARCPSGNVWTLWQLAFHGSQQRDTSPSLTVLALLRPLDGDRYVFSIAPASSAIAKRSSWRRGHWPLDIAGLIFRHRTLMATPLMAPDMRNLWRSSSNSTGRASGCGLAGQFR